MQLAKDCNASEQEAVIHTSPSLYVPPVPPALVQNGHGSAPSSLPRDILVGRKELTAGQEISPRLPDLAVILTTQPWLPEASASPTGKADLILCQP